MFRNLLTHRHFILYAKLTYGVFLSNTIFMQYRAFNLENGIWAQVFETNLSFVAHLAFSFIFSAITYLLVEAPFANILNDFFRSKISRIGGSDQHYRSQSAKAHLRDKSKKEKIIKDKESKTKIKTLNIQDTSIDTESDKPDDLSKSLISSDENNDSLI